MGMFGNRLQQPIDESNGPYITSADPVFNQMSPELLAPMPKKRGLFGGGLGKALGTVAGVAMMGPAYFAFQQGRKHGAAKRAAALEEDLARAEYYRNQNQPDQFEDMTGEDGSIFAQRNIRTREVKPINPYERSSSVERMMQQYLDPATPPHLKKLYGANIPGTPEYLETQAKLYGGRAEAQFPYSATAHKPAGGSTGLRVGQVVDGYTYVGGDPNDQSSWRQ